jgi:hypothetical protein
MPTPSLPSGSQLVGVWHGVAAVLRLSQEEAGLRPCSQASAPAPGPPARAEGAEVGSEQLARALQMAMQVGLLGKCTNESSFDPGFPWIPSTSL